MKAGYRIRPAVGADLGEIVALDRATRNQPHWSLADYAASLHANGAGGRPAGSAARRCLFVAEMAGQIAGVAVGKVVAIEDAVLAELESVGVADAARRMGIGRALCDAVIGWCKEHGAREIELEVRSGGDGPIALYRGMGFVEIGRRARYYRDPADDAVLMRLKIG